MPWSDVCIVVDSLVSVTVCCWSGYLSVVVSCPNNDIILRDLIEYILDLPPVGVSSISPVVHMGCICIDQVNVLFVYIGA